MNNQTDTDSALPNEPVPRPPDVSIPKPGDLPDYPVPKPDEPLPKPSEPQHPTPPYDPGQPTPAVPQPVTIPSENEPSPLI